MNRRNPQEVVGFLSKRIPGREPIDNLDRIVARAAFHWGDDDPDIIALREAADMLRTVRWAVRGGAWLVTSNRHTNDIQNPPDVTK